MRFNPQQKLSAAEVLNTYPQAELERIFREFGEERHWRAIAREVVKQREVVPLEVAKDLVSIVRSIVGERFLNKSLARIFQALRIEVNQELQRLQTSLEDAYRMLKKGGRLVVISYHSLEDRIVKEFFREKHRSCICPPELPACVCDKVQEMKILTPRPVVPEEKEVRSNPRSRSAKLRAAEKLVEFAEGELQ
jgi:16S rRNA (cytosine1402-N4)-methyltransferase